MNRRPWPNSCAAAAKRIGGYDGESPSRAAILAAGERQMGPSVVSQYNLRR